ncbi:MAG: L-threonylcarbamoyladenylate synthase [Polyangia bacterium]|jgi:tRNA threonylcarbamoyl adenosine modification protein (Sua5/YciO/YrdC/YwlC family)
MLIELHPEHPEPRKIRRAVEALRKGEVIAYPTDTAYGLGVDLLSRPAIDRLYQVKGIPRTQQLAFLCHDLSDVARYTVVEQDAYRLLKRALPGPYTFILKATREVPKNLHSRRRTVGVRVPAHPVPIALVRELGHPILSTTANRHGEPPVIDPREIELTFPGVSIVLDGGLGGEGLTTVIDLTENAVVREGMGAIDGLF